MSVLKIQKLLSLLPPKELKEFSGVMEQDKRESLKKLFNAITYKLKAKSELDKREVFSATFGKSYHKDLDYLFRNETRLLNERLQQFLIDKEAKQELKNDHHRRNRLLLQALFKHGMFEEYESLFIRYFNKAMEELAYDEVQKMADQHFTFLMTKKEISPVQLSSAYELLSKQLMAVKLAYRNGVAINQQSKVAIEAALAAMGQVVEESTVIGADTEVATVTDARVVFYEQAGLANQSAGQQSITHAKAAVDAISQIEELYPNSKVDALAILGGAYQKSQQYQGAANAYATALSFSTKNKLRFRMDALFNLASVLMKLEHYDSVIELIEKYREEIAANPKVKFRFECFHCFCYIFKKDEDGARNIIPAQIGKRPYTEYQYFRFIYCILPFLRKDYEEGLREASNYVNYFNRHGDKLALKHEKELALVFKRFYSLHLDSTDKQTFSNGLALLRGELESYKSLYPQYHDFLYLKWLEARLQT